MKILKLKSKKSKAQAMVEFAIALPILLLILYGLIETGRYILIVSSVNNASRQAARYGSTVGASTFTGSNGVPRYQDCQGIKAAALRVNFMRSFATNNIAITYDGGPGTSAKSFSPCDGPTDGTVTPSTSNTDRIGVTITAQFQPLVRLVPFQPRTITATSYRTIIMSISIGSAPTSSRSTNTAVTTIGTSEIGQTVTVNVTVSGNTTPTGTVVITGADINCTATLNNGTGSCVVTFNAHATPLPETRTLVATYSGDANHDASSGSTPHIVTKASTATTITADTPDPSNTNAQVVVTVSVTSSFGTPTGTVSITGANTNCTINLPANNCNVIFTSIGAQTLTATYNGDNEHLASSSTASHTVINGNDTTTTITTPSTSTSLSVSLGVSVVGGVTPQGTVVFREGSTTLCTATLSGGGGSCNYTFSSAGAKNVTATYTSTNGLNGSTISKTITVGSSAISLSAGTPSNGVVRITANTSNIPNNGVVAITGADVNCNITISGNTGFCDVTFNSSGSKTLTGTYSGDSTHAPSSGTVNLTVTVASNISCAISAYTLNSWSNGFNADPVTIQNTGTTAINGWTLTWTFPNGQTVNNMWNASYTQSGSNVTATNMSYNGTINPGGTVSFGFGGSHSGTNHYPTNFKVNGTSCTPPPVAACSTSTIILSNLNITGGTLNLPINNSLPSAILIKDVTVTWYHDKGHVVTNNKELFMQTASVGGVTFWTGNDTDGTNIITPASPTYIPTGTSTMTFTYHQDQRAWKPGNGDTVTINLATPGCTSVVLYQNQH